MNSDAPRRICYRVYKRSLQPELPEEIATWYNRKSFSVMKESHDLDELFKPQLVNTLVDAFTQLAPLYIFLICVEDENLGVEYTNTMQY